MVPARCPSAGTGSAPASPRRAAGRPPPWAITASAANCADPAKTSADIAIAPIAEKPAWTASTPKESETTLLANAYGVPARTPAQKDARGGLSWSSPGIRAAPDPDHAIPGPSEIDAPHRRKGPPTALAESRRRGTRAHPPGQLTAGVVTHDA
jgi:hypothetical protein